MSLNYRSNDQHPCAKANSNKFETERIEQIAQDCCALTVELLRMNLDAYVQELGEHIDAAQRSDGRFFPAE
jgi:hypothetical protein